MDTDQELNFKISDSKLKDFIESIRPKDEKLRKKVDMGYSWNSVQAILFEIRPNFLDPAQTVKIPIAKLRFSKSKCLWKLYWMRGSGNWEPYERNPVNTKLLNLLKSIKKDTYGCFWG